LFSSVSSTTDTWGITEVELADNETINPDESKTFTFDITAPASEGVYKFQWQMKQEGVEWIGNASTERLIKVANEINYLDDCDALTDWNSSVTLTLNEADQQQGSGCIEFVGTKDDELEFEKVFATPYNSGISAFDAVLQFWYYTSDASVIDDGLEVTLGSAGSIDADAYTWKVSDLTTGWNLVTLAVSEGDVKGIVDMDAINWFSINNTKTDDVTSRIDEIQILDKYAGSTRYDLIVNDGTGSGKYVEDAIVNIVANEAPVGKLFVGWVVNSGTPLFENAKEKSTKIRISGGNVEISAEYKLMGGYFDDCDNLTGWGSSAGLVLNTTDQKEGAACVEFSGDQTDDYKKAFAKPYNSGATHETGKLEFWYYVSNASLLSDNNQIEIGSAGRPDQNEYNWSMNISALVNGWNRISLPFTEASVMDEVDLSALNWFRIYNFKSGSVVTRIDAIEIVDPNGGTRNILTVKNGEGDGTYFTGTEVTITADPATGGALFYEWVIEEGNPTIEDVKAVFTKLTMGDEDAVVAATYKEPVKYEVIVNNGTGGGMYNPGASPVITANEAPEGQEFVKWEVNSGNVTLSNENAELTYFTMPEENVEVTATYRNLVSVHSKKDYTFTVYPNPAVSEVSVDFTLEKLSDVNISVLDLSGRSVGLNVSKNEMSAGNYRFNLAVSDLNSGSYLVNIKINNVEYSELLIIEE